jgi:hypothetical protein
VIESYVDLTYHGLSLGRRIKLTQVRPSSGTLELASPMPVGTHVAITTDQGVTFDATVSWVYEQITGSDRTPGMVVVPVLAADPASAWWQARVALPDEDKPKPRASRDRPMPVRSRPATELSPPPEEAVTDEIPTSIAEHQARLHAAARGDEPRPAGAPPDPGDRSVIVNALDPQVVAPPTSTTHDEAVMPHPGEHAVIDDGPKTLTMAQLDPTTLDDSGASAEAAAEAAGASAAEAGAGAGAAAGANDDAAAGAGDDGDDGEANEAGEPGEANEASEPSPASRGDKPAAGRSFKKRRKRR